MTTIPTEEALRKLPRLAVVAFAARCARRVLPVYRASNPAEKDLRAVERVVDLAERYAAATVTASFDAAAVETATVFVTGHAARASSLAASAAYNAASDAYDYARGAADIGRVASIARSACAAATSVTAARDMAAAIRHDFDDLLRASRRDSWTDDTPVLPEFFLPMWPQGEPEGWPGS